MGRQAVFTGKWLGDSFLKLFSGIAWLPGSVKSRASMCAPAAGMVDKYKWFSKWLQESVPGISGKGEGTCG
ncbi:hypothetical protein SAMN02745221_01671 [Thermosyntropha lipolytica DSM 11003]|uniref:Uncharacterized protein n=1 Tax=Thermosyntropha lipolytica DSM 11003 TaxID=1123382 RepID=A0A1M5Q6N1_9FIRM|nr:hypothetical protein [Thermosyntropha lipolytica]SHH09550.1 hypothetical protein SAMN02745221_01671 [Thermosyntropha lipolytica DSM 11003]